MTRARILYLKLATICLGLSATPMMGESVNLKSELWVDGPGAKQPGTDRNRPHAATDELGRAIYVWDAFNATGGDRSDIFMRRFDATGSPLSDPLFVNSYTTIDQRWPRVAASSDGSFLVTWESREPNQATTGTSSWFRSQAFDSTGSKVGTEHLLSSLSPELPGENSPDVAALRVADGSPGGYVVVWQSAQTNGNDNSGWSVQARLVSPNGSPFGAQFQVNSTIQGSQTEPVVTELPDGGFLVAFKEPAPSGVRGRRFNGAGQPIGNDFPISGTFDNGAAHPDAALGWDGIVAVVWEDAEDSGDANEIRARLFDSDLTPLGPDFRVNELSTNAQLFPSVAELGPSGFLVTWESDVSSGDDAEPRSIEARLITGHNSFDGPQFQLNDFTFDRQEHVGSGGWYGRLAAAWYSSNGNDQTSDDVITGVHVEDCLFCDDFEWGSEWRWSTAVQNTGSDDADAGED